MSALGTSNCQNRQAKRSCKTNKCLCISASHMRVSARRAAVRGTGHSQVFSANPNWCQRPSRLITGGWSARRRILRRILPPPLHGQRFAGQQAIYIGSETEQIRRWCCGIRKPESERGTRISGRHAAAEHARPGTAGMDATGPVPACGTRCQGCVETTQDSRSRRSWSTCNTRSRVISPTVCFARSSGTASMGRSPRGGPSGYSSPGNRNRTRAQLEFRPGTRSASPSGPSCSSTCSGAVLLELGIRSDLPFEVCSCIACSRRFGPARACPGCTRPIR